MRTVGESRSVRRAVLVGVPYEWDFQEERQRTKFRDMPRIINLEAQSLTEAQVRIKRGGTWDDADG